MIDKESWKKVRTMTTRGIISPCMEPVITLSIFVAQLEYGSIGLHA